MKKEIDIEKMLETISPLEYHKMEIRCELIMTREKMAMIFMKTGDEELLKIMGKLYAVIEDIKRL